MLDMWVQKLHQSNEESYFLMLARLRKPNVKILEIIPLLMAHTLCDIWDQAVSDKLADIYGLFGQEKNCQLFIYQYMLNMFSGS